MAGGKSEESGWHWIARSPYGGGEILFEEWEADISRPRPGWTVSGPFVLEASTTTPEVVELRERAVAAMRTLLVEHGLDYDDLHELVFEAIREGS